MTRPNQNVLCWTMTAIVWTLGLAWLAHGAYTALYQGPADILRRWCVSQYVAAGRNPYQVALNVLRQEVGEIGQVRLANRRVFHIPRPRSGEEQLGVLPQYGPPEPVYPPAAQLVFVTGLSWLPEHAVLPVWLVLNLGLVTIWNITITRRAVAEGLVTAPWIPLMSGLCLLWAPTQQTVVSSQFSILIALLLLLSARWQDRHPWLAAWALSLALIKPSMALPFALLPLILGAWRVVAGAVAVHAAASTIVALMVGSTPWGLTRQWFGVTQYFTHGPYSLQTVLNKLGVENTWMGFVLILLFVGGTFAWLVVHRRATQRHIFDFLCLVSVLWTYHGPYDLVLLLVPLIGLGRSRMDATAPLGGRPPALVIAGLAFVALSLATWSPTYVGDDLLCQAVRWLGRGVLVALLVATAWNLRLSIPRSSTVQTSLVACQV